MRTLYTLYDTNSESILGINFAERHDGPAIRTFHSILAQRDSLPNQYPDQFTLIEVGQQNEATGEITPCIPPRTVATGAAWLETQRANATAQLQLTPRAD